MSEKLKEKIKESLMSVLPITAIIVLLCFTIIPTSNDTLMLFISGAILLIIGIGLFTLGAEISMTSIGERIGSHLSSSKKFLLILLIAFVFGAVITIAEPDLQVLASQIVDVPIILVVAIGVGIFLAIALLRIIFNIKLSRILAICYLAIFVMAFFVPETILPIAFDSGGVTTGPMTVPFIIAFGIGIAAVRQSKSSESDSFGLVALCSAGPILAVMILGLICNIKDISYQNIVTPIVADSTGILSVLKEAFPIYIKEVAVALLPIIFFFIIYQIFILKISKSELLKIAVGLVYTFVGLVMFLTGANIGFLPIGNHLGISIAKMGSVPLLLIGMLIGYFIARVEPAVVILVDQINDITDGAISKKLMFTSLAIGTMFAITLAMIRIITEMNILYIVIPGYLLSMILMRFAPEMFVAIAFDSGGVSVGTMASVFVLPFAIGVCTGIGHENIMTGAFGTIAMIAMMPTIVIQIVGILYKFKSKKITQNVKIEEDGIIEFPRRLQDAKRCIDDNNC